MVPIKKLTETKPWFTVYFFDIGQPCYDQLTPVNTGYLLTTIAWPYRRLKFLLFSFVYRVIVKLKTEAQTIYKKPQRKVTKLKSKFYLFLG